VPVHVADRCRYVHRHGDHEDGDDGGDGPPDPRCNHREPDEHPGTNGAHEHPPGAGRPKLLRFLAAARPASDELLQALLAAVDGSIVDRS
jgi:hypothetical protein